MFFDMGIGELLIIGVVGLIVFGPERLPKVAAQAAQFLRQLRDQASQAKASIIEAADIDESTLRDLRDLDPRRALRDVTSPLADVRRVATDAVKIESLHATQPKPTTSSSVTPQTAGDTEPAADTTKSEPPRTSGVDHRDVI